MDRRAASLIARMDARFEEVRARVPSIDPSPCYWLHEDATESYCRKHAIEARARTFDLGAPLADHRSWERDKWEDAFWEGIGATLDGESDNTEQCSKCGETLSYVLTDSGVDQELSYWLEAPLVQVRDEDTYALDRLTLNIWHGSQRRRLLEASAVINQAWRLACRKG